MQCLYCGKQLALLRRLTGGGEFCSDAHKQLYQEEYNRLALSRLLQAQSKPGEIKTKASAVPTEGLGAPLPPGSSRHRALSSSTPESEPSREQPAPEPAESVPSEPVQPVQPVEAPVWVTPEEAPAEASNEPPAVEETAPEIAGFSLELPVSAWLTDGIPYVEPYLDATTSVLISSWQAPGYNPMLSLATPVPLEIGSPLESNGFVASMAIPIEHAEFGTPAVDLNPLSDRSFENLETGAPPGAASAEPFSSLPTAGLLPIQTDSFAASVEPRAMDVVAQPTEFPSGTWNRNVPFAVDTPMPRVFPTASSVTLDLGIAASRRGQPSSLNGTLNFPMGVAFQNSTLLVLSPSGIDFPAEDAEVILAAPWAERLFSSAEVLEQPAEDAVAVMEPSTPRQSLEALSRLHDELAAAQEENQSIAPVEPAAAAVEILEPPAQLQAAEPAGSDESSAPTIEVHAEPVQQEPIPRSAHELFEIPLRTFAPPKPAIMMEADALVNLAPQAPQLKALPLRPKVAKAPPGFSPQSSAPQAKSTTAEAGAKAPAQQAPPRPEVRTKQIPATKSPAKAGPGLKTGPFTKPAQPARAVPAAKFAPVEKPSVEKSSVEKSSVEEAAKPAEQTAATAPPQPQAPAKPKEAKITEPAPAEKTPIGEPEKMPSFATVQPRKKASFLESLKLKLIIAVALAGCAATFFIVHNGKAPAPAPVKQAAAEDVIVGPSIMMGEGGWVQGWSGDVNGSHAGRQITIYRPSLKLSDYRIEFQGEIDSKSVGWVFRALDPYNYYATKLALATPASSGHFSLIKYLVQQGHETELGRTAVNIEAGPEAVLSIRMDVHGSTFKTYVQGQAVDVFSDDRLKSGGVGFLNERAERARVKSVSIFYLTGGKN